MLLTNLAKYSHWALLLGALSLTGCGAVQTVSDGTASVFNAVFYKQIKELHLDFTAREELNTDDMESHSLSQSLVLRVYQLKESKAFKKASYEQLLNDADAALSEDLLATNDVVIKPGTDVNLDVPMDKDAEYVGIIGLFRQPDTVKNKWKLVIEREELDPDDARIIEVGNSQIKLKGFADGSDSDQDDDDKKDD
ncbi:MAG: type VI secretion system lipoprotein TssJ [Vibrio sp.]